MECASERACATAEAEQQLLSPSFSGSAHSSSVTAAASPLGSCAQVGGHGAVDAAAHRHQRAAAGRGLERAARPDGGAERPRERVGGQLGRVQLGRG